MTSQSTVNESIYASHTDVQTLPTDAPAGKREVIDKVFTQRSFEKLYLDAPHSPRKPKFNIEDGNLPLVLHVDDDIDLVNAVTARFRASGYRVASALDGESGMKEALFHAANAIVLDYDMPNGRGDQVIELLKKHEETENIPIVVLTAIHKKGLKRQLLNQGADSFMTKPFEFAELEETVAGLIDSADEG